MIKAIPAENHTIAFDCPKCRLRTKVALDKVGCTYQCRVKCSCGNVFSAEIELREQPRRQLDIPGCYEIGDWKLDAAETHKPSDCRVIDISRNGLAFLKKPGRQLNPGELVRVSFQLDDPAATKIIQECEVRHVKENFVGCLIRKINPDLEDYLLG